MIKCEWQNEYCAEGGTFRRDLNRYLCEEHYIEKKKQQRQMNEAFKKAGLGEIDFNVRKRER